MLKMIFKNSCQDNGNILICWQNNITLLLTETTNTAESENNLLTVAPVEKAYERRQTLLFNSSF